MLLDRLKIKLFSRYLAWRCRPSLLKRYLHAALPQDRPAGRSGEAIVPHGLRSIKAAAVQLELKLCANPFDYADEIHRRLREAVERGAQLIAFPEYGNLPLFGMLPGIEQLEEAYRDEDQKEGSQTGPGLDEIFVLMSPAVESVVGTLYSHLAAAYRVHIMAGSYPLYIRGALVNRAFLFGPSGDLIGCQDKVHLMPQEAAWNVRRGSTLSVFRTSVGALALPVCMDATYYETFRILEAKGAEIILLPIANMEAYNYWPALRGIWPRVQESCLFGVKSALVGSLAGFTFTGRAGIFAPLEITPLRDGVLAEVEPHDREALAVADLDLEALRALRAHHPWRDENPALYRRYLPDLYGL